MPDASSATHTVLQHDSKECGLGGKGLLEGKEMGPKLSSQRLQGGESGQVEKSNQSLWAGKDTAGLKEQLNVVEGESAILDS